MPLHLPVKNRPRPPYPHQERGHVEKAAKLAKMTAPRHVAKLTTRLCFR
jgi:hypothetical protein